MDAFTEQPFRNRQGVGESVQMAHPLAFGDVFIENKSKIQRIIRQQKDGSDQEFA
jgi:hypothetical protein